MDEIIMRFVGLGAATVLNLAAGLDARPYRLELPETLRWLHVDLPDIVDYFRTQMAGERPRCELEFIAADMRDVQARREVFSHAASRGPVLVITEGLLVYLEAEDVADVFVAYAGVAARTEVVAGADVVVRSASLAPVLPLALAGALPRKPADRALFERGLELLEPEYRACMPSHGS